MFEVLVPVDDSIERATAQARAVAELPRGEDVHAVVLHVFDGENPEGASVHQVAAVRRAREALEENGVEVSLAETSGDPAEEILQRARDDDVDLIAVAGRTRSPAGKALFGSVSQSVMLGTERPVLFCTADEA